MASDAPEHEPDILLVEDDDGIAEPLAEGLARQGYRVRRVRTGREALAAGDFDLALLDLGLEDIDGSEVCRRLRARTSRPIIVITARDDELERVLLLDTGADDYLVKPFGFRELVARMRAVLRRVDGARPPAPATDEDVLVVGSLCVDRRRRRATLADIELELTPKEFELLALLAADPGAVRTRDEIIAAVWDPNWWGPTKTLDVHIASLRKKLGDPRWITTARRVGYRLEPPDPSP
jgi:DNA-binding response OmpR family regulator